MIRRVRFRVRTGLLAAALAVLCFEAAGYGMFGAVPATNAILETTSQSPVSLVPRPSPGVDAGGAITATRTSSATPITGAILFALVGLAAIVIWRRISGPQVRPGQPDGDSA